MSRTDDRLLVQFAPLIYVVWSDGILTEAERAEIETRLASVPGASKQVMPLVRHWLNPAQPPTPSELNQLVDLMSRAARGKRAAGRRWLSFSELGRFLAGRDEQENTPELEALRNVEEALGVEGSDALNAILGVRTERFTMQPDAHIAVAKLHACMAGDRLEVWRRVSGLLSADSCRLDPAAPPAQYRQRVLECCRHLADQGLGLLAFPEEFGGAARLTDSIATFETIAYHDISLLVKYGVQFGLFGGSVLQLGTDRHHRQYLRDIGTLRLPGCFAMTESAHGSNVRDIETTATYDEQRREFVIHTPNLMARKDYIGNAAQHGRMATVFAQLEVAGERHGVHAFLVPIRQENGELASGVSIEDCGLKAGLNGVDNGRISFQQVRIPRENLLNRFADVSAEGKYSSDIPSASRRFFTMLGTLVAGRISIAVASCSGARLALTIATRYAAQRRQFGPEGEAEVPVLSYQSMQRQLLPRIATAYALDAALHALVQRYAPLAAPAADRTDNRERDAEQREVEGLAASLKAFSTWYALDTVQAAREACGGAGYMFENRLGTLRNDLDIFTTFEGANVVLQQLVARSLLSDYREQFGELRLWTVIKVLGARATTAVVEQNPINTRKTDPDHLRDPEFHRAALRFREQRLLASVARRLKSRLDDGLDSFAALNACQQHLLTLAQAHAEREILERFHEHIEKCPTPALRKTLQQLAALFALHALERDRAWFMESDYIEAGKSKAIRQQVLELCAELAPSAVNLVDAFGIPQALVRVPIAE